MVIVRERGGVVEVVVGLQSREPVGRGSLVTKPGQVLGVLGVLGVRQGLTAGQTDRQTGSHQEYL